MNVVDSSAWLEYFADGPNARFFADAIEDTDRLVVPTLVVYEVFKHVFRQTDEGRALQAVTAIQQGATVDLTAALAIQAAKLSVEHKLPMADSTILATARAYRATVWTQDEDFAGLDGVEFKKKAG